MLRWFGILAMLVATCDYNRHQFLKRFQSRLARWAAWILASLLVLLALAYLLLPRLTAWLAPKMLPPEVEVQALDLEYPGWNRARARELTLTVQAGGGTYRIRARNLVMNFDLWARQLRTASVEALEVTGPNASASDDPGLPEAIEIPDLPLDRLTVDELKLSRIFADQSRDIHWQKIRVSQSGKSLTINAQIPGPGDKAAPLSLILSPGSGTLSGLAMQIGSGNNTSLLANLNTLSWTDNRFNSTWELTGRLNELLALPDAKPWMTEFGANTLTRALLDSPTELKASGRLSMTPAGTQLTIESASHLSLQPGPTLATQLRESASTHLGDYLRPDEYRDNDAVEKIAIRAMDDLTLMSDDKDVRLSGLVSLKLAGPTGTVTLQVPEIHWQKETTGTALSGLTLGAGFRLFLPPRDREIQLDDLLVTAEQVSVDWTGKLQLKDEMLQVTFNPDSRLQMDSAEFDFQADDASLRRVTLQAPTLRLSGTFANLALDDEVLKLNGSQLDIASQANLPVAMALVDQKQAIKLNAKSLGIKVTWPDTSLMPSVRGQLIAQAVDLGDYNAGIGKLSLGFVAGDPGSGVITGDFTAGQARYENGPVPVTNASATGSFSVDPDKITGRGKARLLPGMADQAYTFTYTNASGRGSLAFPAIATDYTTIAALANPVLQELSSLLTVDQAKIRGNLKVTFEGDSVDGAGSFSITDINAGLGETRINNAELDLELFDLDPLVTRERLRIPELALAAGIDLGQIKVQVEQSETAIEISDLGASLLSGELALAKATYENGALGPATVNLRGIELEPLLTALDVDGLSATGKFDFALPVTISDDAFTIDKGTYASKVRGMLKYQTPGNFADKNLALQALDNFHYTSLKGGISYQENGDYVLAVLLEGANPELYDGYPIKLNMNITGNMPDVMRAAILTGDFSQAIIDSYREGKVTPVEEQP